MPAISNSPSVEYRHHHEAEAPTIDDREFRPAWRRRSRLDKLLTSGAISPEQYRAGLAFRDSYEAAFAGSVRVPDLLAVRLDKHCCRRSAPELSERQAQALTRLRVMEGSLGSLFVIAVWVCVEDWKWCAIAQKLGVASSTAKRWGVIALAALAVV